MATIVKKRPTPKTADRRSVRKNVPTLSREEIALENAIMAAAARDLAKR